MKKKTAFLLNKAQRRQLINLLQKVEIMILERQRIFDDCSTYLKINNLKTLQKLNTARNKRLLKSSQHLKTYFGKFPE